MANKKISELTSTTPSANSVIPASDASGVATNKVTLQSILDLETRWSIFKPGAPTNLSGTAGNSQVSLTWTAPSVLTQTPITDYVVQYSSNSGSTWTTFSDGTSTSASVTVTGLTNGTAYTFRAAGVNAMGQGSWSAASASVTPGVVDSLFSSVVLLLHMDGSDSTFTDSSSYARSITASNATQSVSQSKWGGKSAYFPSSSSLTIANDSLFNMNGVAYCVEAWIYPLTSDEMSLFNRCSGDASSGFSIQKLGDNSILFTTGDGWNSGTSTVVQVNQWNHLACVSDGSEKRVYINGILAGSTDASWSETPTSLVIGDRPSDSRRFYYNGYIDDVRITRGNARYSGSTITVPTAEFPNS